MTIPTDRHRRPFTLDDAMAILARTPATLDVLLRGLPDDWTTANEGGSTWSAFDIVGHLLHGDRTDWVQRARMILDQGEARAFDSFDRLAQFSASEGRTLPDLLDDFDRVRGENLQLLRDLSLSDADLNRRGRHPEFGAVTLRQLLSTWVAHDLDHLMQIARVLGRQYSDEVGPWRVYLRIINGAPL